LFAGAHACGADQGAAAAGDPSGIAGPAGDPGGREAFRRLRARKLDLHFSILKRAK
jgi:hypothetical protein